MIQRKKKENKIMNVSEVQRRADGDQAPRQVGKGAVEGAWFF